MLYNVMLVAAGGAIGAVGRYCVVSALALGAFPLGTLIVNVAGSFLIGLLASAATSPGLIDPQWRLFLQTGLLGAFTTFSAFSLETLSLLQQGEWQLAVLNAVTNLLLCMIAVWLGSLAFGVWQGH